jgi:hypothetical protein
MKLKLTLFALIAGLTAAFAQPQRTSRFPAGTFHQKNVNINGFSVGLYSGFADDSVRNVHTNGFRLEALGMGILSPLIPSSPISEDDEQYSKAMANPASEQINGFNLSPTGTVCDCVTNGISAGLIGQINRGVSGISVSVVMNLAEKHNGIQMAMFNESYVMNGLQLGLSNAGGRVGGLQIGLFNKSTHLKGVQIGLWNTNQKRKLPIINWGF